MIPNPYTLGTGYLFLSQMRKPRLRKSGSLPQGCMVVKIHQTPKALPFNCAARMVEAVGPSDPLPSLLCEWLRLWAHLTSSPSLLCCFYSLHVL